MWRNLAREKFPQPSMMESITRSIHMNKTEDFKALDTKDLHGDIKVKNAFDPSKDYVEELTDSEMFEKDGVQCVKLVGLQRLAHNNRGGVLAVTSDIRHTPARDNPIASVTVQYTFFDGTTFSGSADATPAAHKKPFSLHLVAVAEAKAEGRALRRAFNISRITYDELGSVEVAGGNTDTDPVTSQSLKGIRVMAKRKNIDPEDVLKLAGKDVTDLATLNQEQGRNLMKRLNAKKVKVVVVK